MRNSRGGLGGTPSPGRAGAPQASARSRQAKATERASGLQDRPSRRRVIAVCRALPWCDLTPKRKRREDFANWRGRYWCPCREQRPTVSGGAPSPNAAHQTSHLSLARAIGKPKFKYFFSYGGLLGFLISRRREVKNGRFRRTNGSGASM